MTNKKRQRYRVMFTKTSPLVTGLILVAVVLSTVALVTLHAGIEESRNQYEAMRQHAMTLEGENQELDQRIGALGSIESALRIALEELGLVLPDTIVLTPGN
jgi:cell division protein FtsL